jgi:hypothetical protein
LGHALGHGPHQLALIKSQTLSSQERDQVIQLIGLHNFIAEFQVVSHLLHKTACVFQGHGHSFAFAPAARFILSINLKDALEAQRDTLADDFSDGDYYG